MRVGLAFSAILEEDKLRNKKCSKKLCGNQGNSKEIEGQHIENY
jgi:hypothetical protein